jgi:Tol biopolymer transport system component
MIIYQVRNGPCLSNLARTVIWGVEVSDQRWIKFRTFGYCGMLGRVAWLPDEDRAIVQFGGDGPPGLYVADYEKGKLTSLAELSDFDGSTELGWTLSPAEPRLAVTNNRGLRLWSLEEKKSVLLEEWANQPSWSPDGHLLYYWWNASPETLVQELRVYDLSTKSSRTLLTEADLALVYRDTEAGRSLSLHEFLGFELPYAVSPDGRWVAIWWGRWLQLVELRSNS